MATGNNQRHFQFADFWIVAACLLGAAVFAPDPLSYVCVVGPALVVIAAHTPSDIIGGALVGLLVLVPANAVVRQARRERASRFPIPVRS